MDLRSGQGLTMLPVSPCRKQPVRRSCKQLQRYQRRDDHGPAATWRRHNYCCTTWLTRKDLKLATNTAPVAAHASDEPAGPSDTSTEAMQLNTRRPSGAHILQLETGESINVRKLVAEEEAPQPPMEDYQASKEKWHQVSWPSFLLPFLSCSSNDCTGTFVLACDLPVSGHFTAMYGADARR